MRGLKGSALDLDAGRITVDWQRTTAGIRSLRADRRRTSPRTTSTSTEDDVDLDDTTVAVLKALERWHRHRHRSKRLWHSAIGLTSDTYGHLVGRAGKRGGRGPGGAGASQAGYLTTYDQDP